MFLNIDNRRNTKKISQALIKGESIIYACAIHSGIFAWSVALFIVAILVGAFFHPFMGALLLFVDVFYFAKAYILFTSTELVLTNKRVLAYYGIFVTDLLQIGHKRLESAHIEQTLLGSILGYKTVTIRGTGQGSIPIAYIADAIYFKKHLDEILFADEDEN